MLARGGGGQGEAHSSAQPSPVHCLRESNTLRNPRGRSPYFILRIVAFLTILRCNQPFSSCELVILVVLVPLKALVPFQSLHPILFSPFSSCAFWRGLGARCEHFDQCETTDPLFYILYIIRTKAFSQY